MNEANQIYNKNHPFTASVKERYPLSKQGSKKHTHHVVLDLSHSGISYNVGDSLAIFPVHDPELVQRTLQAIGASGMEKVTDKHTGSLYSFRDYLAKKANITDVSRKLISELALRQTNPRKKEHLDSLLQEGNKDAFKEYHKNHELWDTLLEHPEVRFTPEEICHLIQPMLPRFYSIASSMKVVGEEVHLTVSYVKFTSSGHQRLGVCSHYLCDMAPLNLATVPVYVQPHHGFTLPPDPSVDLIMIGPGTGVAPYRAFMQERMAMGDSGKHWLFFGEWNRSYDYFYEDYWDELKSQGRL
jgi:sulfite reductase (NADPH) flavoprotein alpha-component